MPGFYDILKYQRDGDFTKDFMRMMERMDQLEKENSEMKSQLIRALTQMQELFLLVQRSNEKR